MKHRRFHLPLAIVAALWLVLAGYVLSTSAQMPERVATHFGGNGQADGWMTRTQHVGFTLLVGLGLPAFTIGLFAFIARCGGCGLNIPHKEYWIAPERREQTFDFIRHQGFWPAGFFLAFLAAIHTSILAANAQTPARLPMVEVSWISGLFTAAMAIWLTCLLGRFFRKPR